MRPPGVGNKRSPKRLQTGPETATFPGRDAAKGRDWEETRHDSCPFSGAPSGACVSAAILAASAGAAPGRSGGRIRPELRRAVLRALDRQHQVLPVPKKEGPYRVALANGYIANTWRIQMIKTAKAYAAQPEVKAKLKGVQGRLDRRGCRGADLGGEQLHRFGLRRHHHRRPEPHRLRPRDQARQGRRRRAGRLRQHARHR